MRFEQVAQANVTLSRLAKACSDSGHAYCDSSGNCSALYEASKADYQAEVAAACYDVHTSTAIRYDEVPDDSWPTAALLRLVSNLVKDPPWRDPLRRSIRLTTALARLGERGLKADIIMRTCLGPQFVRHVLLVTGSFWLHHDTENPAPQQLRAWFDLFDNLQLTDASLLAIISEAGTGALAQRTQEWLATGAIAHLIDWNLDCLIVTPDWGVLPGGRDATLWVWDRFTATSTDLWRSDSLSWEIAFAEEPEDVANVVGLPVSLLRERPASAAMAVRSLRRRVTGRSDAHQILSGLTADEIAQNILGLIQTDNLADASELARRAWESAPSIFILANAAAFCLIPTNPSEAVRILSDLKPQNADHRALVYANLTAAAVTGAEWKCDDPPPIILPAFEAYLWDLETLTTRPQIKYIKVADWLTQVNSAR